MTQFNTADVKTDEVGPLTGDVIDAGTRVRIGTIRQTLPLRAIGHIVLMTEEDRSALLARAERTCQQEQYLRFEI
jgi:hypothetical protein